MTSMTTRTLGPVPPPPPQPRPYPFASRDERAWVPAPTTTPTSAATTSNNATPTSSRSMQLQNTSMEVHPPSSSSKPWLYGTRSTPSHSTPSNHNSNSNSASDVSASVTQAMRNDLEGLIEYIDGLAFQLSPTATEQPERQLQQQQQQQEQQKKQKQEDPPPRRRRQQQQQFINENSGRKQQAVVPLLYHNNRNKPVFRDRSNGNEFVDTKCTTKGGDGTTRSRSSNNNKSSTTRNSNNNLPDLTMLISKNMDSKKTANGNKNRDDDEYQNNDSRYLDEYQNHHIFPPHRHAHHQQHQQHQYQTHNRNGQLSLAPPIGNLPPPTHHDSSLYLQEEDDASLSLILSRSSVADDDDDDVVQDADEKVQHYARRSEPPLGRNSNSINNNAPTPRILAQVEGRLSRIGTSMTTPSSRNSHHFGFQKSTKNSQFTHGHHQHHQHQSPPGVHLSKSSAAAPPGTTSTSRNVEPLMELNRVPSHKKSITSTLKKSLSSSPPARQTMTAATATPNNFRGDSRNFAANSSRRDPTPMKNQKNQMPVNSTGSPVADVGDSFDGFLRTSNISTPDNLRRFDDKDTNDESGLLFEGGSKPTLSVAVDATPRLDGKVSHRLIPSEDPNEYEGEFQSQWTVSAGDAQQGAFDVNNSTTSSSSSGIMRNIDKYTLYRHDTPETQTRIQNYNETTPAQRPQRNSTETLSPPESARKLLNDAVQAVQDARIERQSARIWADEVKDEVSRWVSEQRELIRTESRATNSPTSGVTTSSYLVQLEQTIQNLHQDLARSYSSREDSDRKLEHLLLDQGKHIRTMSAQLETLKTKLNNSVSDSQSGLNAITKLPNKVDVGVGTTTAKTPNVSSRNGSGIPSFIDRTPKVNSADAMKGINRSINTPGRSILTATTHSSCNSHRIRRRTPNGGYITEYSNGSIKEVHPDGTTVTRFPNGDVETKFRSFITSPPRPGKVSTPSSMSVQASPRGIVAYFYSKDAILQISQNDGSKLFEYQNGQVEKHYPDGFKMILYSDGTKQGVTQDGQVIEYAK
eukprot:CAMPEP_0113522732 /NCGR_PEP_ID=MMETSP0014_2-20120614/45345_1 /TAXON_ID=2857 /ORGANISM="Nitzschia sp." /LENGTH=1029 /DNA_ID=CAMNT_0000420807 /DNA_START=4 /DNA_END=3093 /DNA_ORIENTATION=- /assembly_acc=CAM_ASM_000159